MTELALDTPGGPRTGPLRIASEARGPTKASGPIRLPSQTPTLDIEANVSSTLPGGSSSETFTAGGADTWSKVQRVGARAITVLEGLGMAAALLVTATTLGVTYADAARAEQVLPGVTVAGTDLGGKTKAEVQAMLPTLVEARLDQPIVLRAAGISVTTTARGLGATPIVEGTVDAALRYGHDGGLVENLQARVAARSGGVQLQVPLAFDESAALAELERLAPDLERPSLPTRLDLEGRKVLPATRGTSLLPADSLSAIAVGLASGADEIDLVVHTKEPVEDPLAHVASDLDISTVVGRFSTRYQEDANYADRAYNLKVGAQAIDGTVILPGETLSFNAVVGDRSSEAGYRYAGGITGGELIDVVGGGICQISSTLYGASFFAGLEFGAYRPHSRPSTYVDMGLDSTVVYGSQDLEIRNDFDFPVVIHMTVKSGVVEAEILGARRPYQVTFERKLDEVEPFKVVEREDSSLRAGTTKVAQRGMRGFRLTRKRILSQGGSVVETETSNLYYPPTTEIVHRGTNPTGALPEQQSLPKLRDPQPSLEIRQ